MEYKRILSSRFDSNLYLFYSKEHKEAVLFDAGGSLGEVLKVLEEEEVELKYIVLTHGHFDHILIAEELREKTGAKIIIHQNDAELIADGEKNFSTKYSGIGEISFKADIEIETPYSLEVMGTELKFVHTPGHTKGSMVIEVGAYLVTGDTLFKRSIGRTDLYGGSMRSMYNSLKLIGKLNKELIILPGHGPQSTLAEELKENQYMRMA